MYSYNLFKKQGELNYMLFTQNLTTIDPVVSEIICLIKIDTHDRQTSDDKQPGTRDLLFRTLGVMKRGENIKVPIRSMDPITILP